MTYSLLYSYIYLFTVCQHKQSWFFFLDICLLFQGAFRLSIYDLLYIPLLTLISLQSAIFFQSVVSTGIAEKFKLLFTYCFQSIIVYCTPTSFTIFCLFFVCVYIYSWVIYNNIKRKECSTIWRFSING